MSNYIQATFFAPKDALLPGNPAKLIRGADVDPELAAIAAAIATKLDSSSAANPTASIGLSAVNGAASTYMRSDAAPQLSQAIVPTWTGQHTFNSGVVVSTASGVAVDATGIQTPIAFRLSGPNTGAGWNLAFRDTTNTINRGFIGLGTNAVTGAAVTDFVFSPGVGGRIVIATANGAAIGSIFGSGGNVTINAPSSGVALAVTALANARPLTLTSPNTASQSFGPLISAGTNSSDNALTINNAAASLTYFQVRGDGLIQGNGPVAAALVDMTPDTGTFTATYTGMTASVTGTATWTRIGKLVLLNLPVATGTSNSASFTVTGLPAAIQPATLTQIVPVGFAQNNSGVVTNAAAQITAGSGTITMWVAGSTLWTNAGTKGISNNSQTIAYLLN